MFDKEQPGPNEVEVRMARVAVVDGLEFQFRLAADVQLHGDGRGLAGQVLHLAEQLIVFGAGIEAGSGQTWKVTFP